MQRLWTLVPGHLSSHSALSSYGPFAQLTLWRLSVSLRPLVQTLGNCPASGALWSSAMPPSLGRSRVNNNYNYIKLGNQHAVPNKNPTFNQAKTTIHYSFRHVHVLTKNRENTRGHHILQWFLNLLEVPNPESFMWAFTEPFVQIQNISVNKLEPKVNYAAVAHKILLFKERKRTKHEFHRKTQLNKYIPQINAFFAVGFQKQF